MRKEAGPIDAVVDKINEIGATVHGIAKKVPGLDWAAELGEMSLSDNKYLRAIQILTSAIGLPIAPLAIYSLMKKVMAGGPEGEKIGNQVVSFMEKNQDKLVAQAKQHLQQRPQQRTQPVAASFPSVKNPRLRARLIRCAASIKMLEEIQKMAGDDLMLLPAEGEDDEEGDDFEAGIVEDIGNVVAPRTTQNVKDILSETEDDDVDATCGDDHEACGMDDGSYPAGPRNDPNQSRYRVEPGHGQSSVDLLRFTASLDNLIGRIEKAANG